MSIKLTIFDGVTPMLDEIATIHYGMGLDALDHAGSALRDATRQAMWLGGAHRWNQSVEMATQGKNKGRPTRRIFLGKVRAVGKMMSHRTGSVHKPGHIKNFITSYLMERSMTMVVAGKHKAFRAKTRRNGKVVGSQRRTQAVGKGSYGILQKLNNGGSYDQQSSDYKQHARGKTMDSFKNARYKPRRFIEKGRASAMPMVRHIMTTKLEKLIGQQINRAQVKAREVA